MASLYLHLLGHTSRVAPLPFRERASGRHTMNQIVKSLLFESMVSFAVDPAVLSYATAATLLWLPQRTPTRNAGTRQKFNEAKSERTTHD
jgi:hypothetical protein